MYIQTDEELVLRIREGEITAFELLIRRYQNKLIRFVMRLVWDHHTAEEVVSDTFFAVYRYVNRIDIQKKFTTYLFEIAKNTAISALRKKKQTLSLTAIDDFAADEFIYEYVAQREKKAQIAKAIAHLDLRYQRVIRLYYFDDLSYEQIGRILKLPVNTVRTHLRRAKDELKKYLVYEKI